MSNVTMIVHVFSNRQFSSRSRFYGSREVCVPECHFPGTGFFPVKSGKFPVPSIREDPLPGPVSVPPFGTGQLPSRLSPKNETGIPKFEISGKFGKNSRNLLLDGKFPVGYWNMLYESRPNKTSEKIFLLGAEIWNNHIVVENLCKNVRWFYLKFLGGGFNRSLSIFAPTC